MTDGKDPLNDVEFGMGDAPKDYWDDFGADDWEWVARAITHENLESKAKALFSVLQGEVGRDLKKFFDKEGPKFEIGDPTVQESIWGPFFQALESVAEFERRVREYHHSNYPHGTERP